MLKAVSEFMDTKKKSGTQKPPAGKDGAKKKVKKGTSTKAKNEGGEKSAAKPKSKSVKKVKKDAFKLMSLEEIEELFENKTKRFNERMAEW